MNKYGSLFPTGSFHFESLRNTKAKTKDVHYHSGFEIYYLVEGACWYFIDNKSYRLTAGDIALVPPGIIHKTSYETKTFSRMLIYCAPSLVPSSARECLRAIPLFPKSDSTETQIRSFFAALQKEYTAPDTFSEDVIKSIFAEFLLLIAREGKNIGSIQGDSPVVEMAVKYIRSHYMDTVSLQDIADYCFVTREHLSRIFKRKTGFGVNEYLNVYRMQKAESMLKSDPTVRISTVALSCGFNDSNYFSKIYKKMYGISPSAAKKGQGNS